MFIEAYHKTMKHEGGYSNHPNDRGGETYKGISRVHHPDWKGWIIVDRIKSDSDLSFADSPPLQDLVWKFYKIKYWDSIKLDNVSYIYNSVAEELFDISVNFGFKKAATTLQRALNILNRDKKSTDLKVDGLIGNKTLSRINKYKEKILLKLIILLKAKYYIDIVEKNTSQEVFIRGWLTRINLKS